MISFVKGHDGVLLQDETLQEFADACSRISDTHAKIQLAELMTMISLFYDLPTDDYEFVTDRELTVRPDHELTDDKEIAPGGG